MLCSGTEILYKQYGDKEGSSPSEEGSSIIPKTKRRIEVKTKVNQKQATTDGMRKFLIDQITKSGGMIEFGELLQVHAPIHTVVLIFSFSTWNSW